MLSNPFTPADIASSPDDFFGRAEELATLERSLLKGSVVIEGPIGIGKSSLLSRGLLAMDGFSSERRAQYTTAVADKGIHTIDHAARLILENFTNVDERRNGLKVKLGTIVEIESAELCTFFKEGRHLAALKRMLEKEYLDRLLGEREMLIIAVDEADKAPIPLAQLIRSLVTHTQQLGIQNLRFLLAGVRPFFQQMVAEDAGIRRFFYKTITLDTMTPEEASDLVQTKLSLVATTAEQNGLTLVVSPHVVTRIVSLSGGHPHILQLLGSHLIEHEDEDPDGILDSKDLLNSLRRVCYEDRAFVYDTTLHHLENHGKLQPLQVLLGMTNESPPGIVSVSFPTEISRDLARTSLEKNTIQWLVEHNILSTHTDGVYGLVDEFLRIRLFLDQLDTTVLPDDAERQLIARASTSPFWEPSFNPAELDNDDDLYVEEDPYKEDNDDD